MVYPNNCIRGIPHQDFLLDDGGVKSHLFYFDPKFNREDGWCKQSINWEDDNEAIDFTMNQRKETGELQFSAGVAILQRLELDRLKNRPTVKGIFKYERGELTLNKYHGNLLLKNDTTKTKMKQIAAGIALIISNIIFRK